MKSNFAVVGLLFGILSALFSCNKQAERITVANVEGEEICMEEIDLLVKNSLFEYLFAIYDVRRIALNELIDNKLIAKEAKAHHVSRDSIISIKINELRGEITKDQYIADNALKGGVVDERNPFKLFPLNTPEGQRILEESYVKFLRLTFRKELRTKYKVDISLEPPETPKLDLGGVTAYKRGNMHSKNVVTIVSDFDCAVCQSKEPILRQLFNKYKDKVRFDYVHLSSSLNESVLFSTCAAKQGKFWEAHDLLFEMKKNGSLNKDSIISDLELDKPDCEACMRDGKTANEVNASMERLRALGITVTPTIIINNRIYYGEISEEIMGESIEKSLK